MNLNSFEKCIGKYYLIDCIWSVKPKIAKLLGIWDEKEILVFGLMEETPFIHDGNGLGRKGYCYFTAPCKIIKELKEDEIMMEML